MQDPARLSLTPELHVEFESRACQAGVAGRKGRFCQKHQEPLKLFCKEDEALICLVCDRSKEHRDHKTLPLEEASQEYKDQFCNRLEILKKERERIVGCKADVSKESKALLKQTTGDKQRDSEKFGNYAHFWRNKRNVCLFRIKQAEKSSNQGPAWLNSLSSPRWTASSRRSGEVSAAKPVISAGCQASCRDKWIFLINLLYTGRV
uniref:Uncharacterized protein n=1 Tax=Sphaerodactylus townsendi TaxID=933632 RepID=A0ACB8EFG5_9SAUR